MKPYILQFKKNVGLKLVDGRWRTNVVDLYDNDQYKNYSLKRSNYGSNALGNGIYTGSNRVSSTQTDIGYIEEHASPVSDRFVDTTSRLDIVAWQIDIAATGTATGAPIPVLNVYHTEDNPQIGTLLATPTVGTDPADWAYQTGIRETDDIYIIDAFRYAFFEVEFDGDPVNFDFTLQILVEIDPPVVDGFFTRSGNVIGKFPSWMAINEFDPQDPTYANVATPVSTGAQFLNALAGEWLTDIAAKLDYQQAQYYIGSVDRSQKDWIYRAMGVPTVVTSIKGDGVELARAADLHEFYEAESDDFASFWERGNSEIYVLKKYNTLTVNGVVYDLLPYHVWNSIDDIGATVDLFRLRLETNDNFIKRILDVYRNAPGASLEGFKTAIRRELDMWRLEGATPDSDYAGATPHVFEFKDLEDNPDYFTERGIPTPKMKALVEEIATKYPITWGYFTFNQAYWDTDGLGREGVQYLPRLFDATPVDEKYIDSGVGDGNDIYLFRPDPNMGKVDFETKLKVRGRQRSLRTEYGPLIFDVAVYGQADLDFYANPVFSGKFTLELTTNAATPKTIFTTFDISTQSDVNYNMATPTGASYFEWNSLNGFSNPLLNFFDKGTGIRFFNSTSPSGQPRIDLSTIATVTVKPGAWNPESQTYTNVPTQANYKAWFVHAPSTIMGASGATQLQKTSYNFYDQPSNIFFQSTLTSHSIVTDAFVTDRRIYTVRINEANPPTTTTNYVLDIPNLFFPSNASNKELIVELLTRNGTTYGANTDQDAATPIFLPSSYIQVNGDSTWTGSSLNKKSLPVATSQVTFSSGTGVAYPYQAPVWNAFEATQLAPITGTVDQNGPWRDGEQLPENNTNYVLKQLIGLNRASFGIPNTTDYILTWIGIGSSNSDNVLSWTEANTIKPAVAYPGEYNYVPEYPDNAIEETPVGADYTFGPVTVYAKLKPGINEKWLPKVHSGWFYDELDEYYLYANPKTVTLGSYADKARIRVPSITGNYITTPDTAALDITGDMTMIAHVAPTDWTPTVQTGIISKYVTTGNQRSYYLAITTTGNVLFQWSTTGADFIQALSTVPVGLADDTARWIASTMDVNNGASGYTVRFWTSLNGYDWAQLGNPVIVGGVTSIFNSNSPVQLSGFGTGVAHTQGFAGTIYHASIRNGIGANGTVGGTEVFRFDGTEDFKSTDTLFTSASGHQMTVGYVGNTATPGTQLIPSTREFYINDVNRQGAPIVVDAYGGATPSKQRSLRQVSSFYMDDKATPATPSLTLYQTEKMMGNGTSMFFTAYGDIREISVRNLTLDLVVPILSTTSRDNTVTLTAPSDENYEYEIIYQANYSYFVSNGPDKMRVALDRNQYDSYSLTYESSTYDPATPIDVPLNMMYTSVDEGFIYIDHDVYDVDRIELTVSPSRIVSNGTDYGQVTVRTYDAYGNPKPGQTVQLYTNFGILANASVVTDDNGFAYTALSSEVWDGTFNPSPATPSLAAPAPANGYRGQVLALVGNKTSLATFSVDIPAPRTNNIYASTVSDAVLADGQAAASIQGKIETADHAPISGAKIYWRKGRTIYDTLAKINWTESAATPGNTNNAGYVYSDASGRFIVEPFLSKTEPGYWFVAVESQGFNAPATPTTFTRVGDIVSWYEYPNVNAASDPITNLPIANNQDATPSWDIPNYTLGSVFPVTYDEEDFYDTLNGATPQWTPPRWYAINRYRQYQMGLRGSGYYDVGATPAHPDYKEF